MILKRRIERERKKLYCIRFRPAVTFIRNIWQPWGNTSNFKCVIINNWYNSLSNTLVGNRGNYTFLWQLLVLISQHSILSVFEQRMTLYAGKALSTWVLYPFTGLYKNDKPYLMNTKAENCSYRKGQSVDIIKRHLKLQWMLDRSVTISKYKIFNRKTWAESRLQIGFWRYEILNK